MITDHLLKFRSSYNKIVSELPAKVLLSDGQAKPTNCPNSFTSI